MNSFESVFVQENMFVETETEATLFLIEEI